MSLPTQESPAIAPITRYRLAVLLLVIGVSGMSQGQLLPLLSILLERSGVPADLNGINSAALYIGIFCMVFFVEKPVRRLGFKKVMMAGIVVLTASLMLFPYTSGHLGVWFVLRLLVGVGNSSLNFTTQLWLVSSSPAERRGTYISLFGMSYGLGFSLGPLGINLLPFGQAVPFIAAGLFFMAVLAMVSRLPDEKPEHVAKTAVGNRYAAVYRMAWYALIPTFLYGLMESSMNGTFPLYGLRIGLSQPTITLLLLAFGVGGLILQLPLGLLSDRIGRKPVLFICGAGGSALFFAIPAAGHRTGMLIVLFGLAGGLVGSIFSLGLAYAADILPRGILPAAQVMSSMLFSTGSILGPAVGGYGIRYVALNSMFLMLGGAFGFFALLGFWFRPKPQGQAAQTPIQL